MKRKIRTMDAVLATMAAFLLVLLKMEQCVGRQSLWHCGSPEIHYFKGATYTMRM